MLHKRCDERIAHLERLLDEAIEKTAQLQSQLVLMVDKPAITFGRATQAGEVHYMDDEAMIEAEARGTAAT